MRSVPTVPSQIGFLQGLQNMMPYDQKTGIYFMEKLIETHFAPVGYNYDATHHALFSRLVGPNGLLGVVKLTPDNQPQEHSIFSPYENDKITLHYDQGQPMHVEHGHKVRVTAAEAQMLRCFQAQHLKLTSSAALQSQSMVQVALTI